jgi:hypothetical protein
MFKDTQFSPKEIWDNLLIKMLEYLSGGLMDKVLVQRSKMLSGILLIKLRPLLNSTRMLLISQESHPTTVKMLLHLTNISHLSKWVSLLKDLLLLRANTNGESLCTQREVWVNLSLTLILMRVLELLFLNSGLTEMVLDQRKRISSRTLREIQKVILLNSTRTQPTSLVLQLIQVMTQSQVLITTGEDQKQQEALLKLMAHQHQKVNISGENQSIQPEEWDNLSQTFNLKKELEPLSSSNGQMETDLVQRSMISSMILLGTLEVMKPNSIKTLLTSQVLLLTLDTIPLQSMNGVLEDLKPLETEICIDYKS